METDPAAAAAAYYALVALVLTFFYPHASKPVASFLQGCKPFQQCLLLLFLQKQTKIVVSIF